MTYDFIPSDNIWVKQEDNAVENAYIALRTSINIVIDELSEFLKNLSFIQNINIVKGSVNTNMESFIFAFIDSGCFLNFRLYAGSGSILSQNVVLVNMEFSYDNNITSTGNSLYGLYEQKLIDGNTYIRFAYGVQLTKTIGAIYGSQFNMRNLLKFNIDTFAIQFEKILDDTNISIQLNRWFPSTQSGIPGTSITYSFNSYRISATRAITNNGIMNQGIQAIARSYLIILPSALANTIGNKYLLGEITYVVIMISANYSYLVPDIEIK